MNTKKLISALAVFTILASLAGCSSDASKKDESDTSANSSVSGSSNSSSSSTSADDTEKEDAIDISDTSVVKSGSVDVSDYNKTIEISSAGTYTLSGTTSQMIYIKAKDAEVNLILDNLNVSNSEGPAIFVRSADQVNITLKGENSLTNGESSEYEALNACLYSKADLSFDGSGTLTIQSNYGHGIKAKDTAQFKNGVYVISAQEDGIHSNEECVIENGSYTVIANNDEGIQSETELTIQNGSFDITSSGDGLRAETSLLVEDGTINISTNSEGMESKDSLTINGGTITIAAVDDAINAADSLVINGGTIKAYSSTNDGIDSNGTLQITGGNVTAVGLKSPETSFDVDNTPFIISGGTIFGAGSNTTYPTSVSQNVLLVGAGTGNVSSVEVTQDGTSILSFTLSSSGQSSSNANLFISSDKLKTGSTYTVLVNGSSVGEVTISEGINTLGSISTMGGGNMMGGNQGGGMGGNQGGFGAGNRR